MCIMRQIKGHIVRADFMCLTYFNFWALIMILFYSLPLILTMSLSLCSQ